MKWRRPGNHWKTGCGPRFIGKDDDGGGDDDDIVELEIMVF